MGLGQDTCQLLPLQLRFLLGARFRGCLQIPQHILGIDFRTLDKTHNGCKFPK